MITEVNACVQAINTVVNAVKNSQKSNDVKYQFDATRQGSTGHIVLNVVNDGDKAITVGVVLEDGYKLTNPKLIASKQIETFNIAKLVYLYHGTRLAGTELHNKKEQKVIIEADGVKYETGESLEEIFDRITNKK